jgi:predicted methyltransferase
MMVKQNLRNALAVALAPVLAALSMLALGAIPCSALDIGYLGPPGAPAEAFPGPRRPVAEIVSPSRSSEKQRDAADEAGQIARLLELAPGMTVGDIGAGSGYHTVRLARRLGPSGRVIAQDVRRDHLSQLARRAQRLKLSNVTFALGEPHDPRLRASSLDAAILVHMYHEVARPYAFLYNLAPALKPGARVGVVDLDKPISEHGTPLALLRCEMAAVGYREIATHQLAGDTGYLAIFAPPREADRRPPRDIGACGSHDAGG